MDRLSSTEGTLCAPACWAEGQWEEARLGGVVDQHCYIQLELRTQACSDIVLSTKQQLHGVPDSKLPMLWQRLN